MKVVPSISILLHYLFSFFILVASPAEPEPLIATVLTLLLQFNNTGRVPPVGVLWLEFHYLLSAVEKE